MHEQLTTLVDGEMVAAGLPLAEQLDPGDIVRLQAISGREGLAARAYQDAWTSLELALAKKVERKKRVSLLESEEKFQAIEAKGGHYAQRASEALDYMPLFRRRMLHEPYDSATLTDLSAKIGRRAVAAAQRFTDRGSFYEAIFKCLAIGQRDPRYVVFPSSPREEESSPITENYNHDVYAIRERKIPIQLKSRHRNGSGGQYTKAVGLVYVSELIYRAAHYSYGPDEWGFTLDSSRTRLKLSPSDQRRLFTHSAYVVNADARGAELTAKDASYVDRLRFAVASSIDQAETSVSTK